MSDEITFRWVDGPEATDEEWQRLDQALAARGYMALNRPTSRLLLAERDGEVRGFIVASVIPHVGPLHVEPSERGTGLATDLADRMFDYLREIEARGWLVIVGNPHVPKLCEARGMHKLEYPVYVAG